MTVQSLGTVLPNRNPNISLPSEKQMKKKERGCVEECTTLVCGQRVWAVKYFEKRCVMFLTTYAFVLPLVEKQKYDSKERKKVPIQVPAIVDIYNSHMGGVDRLDHIIALY